MLKTAIKSVARRLGLDIRRREPVEERFPVEFGAFERDLVREILGQELTMVSKERLVATIMACRHVAEAGVPGAFVECGVWRGGNALAAAAMFKEYGIERDLILFDTFSGMTQPSEEDLGIRNGVPAGELYEEHLVEGQSTWCRASLEDVTANFERAGLLSDRVRFVKGDVGVTLDSMDNLPGSIAVLRLDTDWYESTKKELEVLYPRLSVGGVLIIDDYGCWTGCTRAVDEYFAANPPRPFLSATDEEGRIGIKGTAAP